METTLPGSPMTATPTVSVCMLTYNHAPYIRQAIEGVLMQRTDFAVELIVGEDCSTDGTRAICREYAAQHPGRIRLLAPEKNIGGLENFFTTLGAAAGKYIAFCEGDDYWTDPLKLQRQVDFLEANPDCGLVYTELDFYYQQKGELRRSVFASGFVRDYDDLETFLVEGGYKAPCTWLFRRELMQWVDRRNITSDATFVMMLEFMGRTRIGFLPEPTAVYRYLAESASHSRDIRKSMNYTCGVLAIQKAYIEKYNLPQRAWDKAGRRMYRMIIPWALALRQTQVIADARDFLKGRKKSFKENIWYLMLCTPSAAGRLCRIKYNLKGSLRKEARREPPKQPQS